MIINGIDLVYEGECTKEVMTQVEEAIKDFWPNHVQEKDKEDPDFILNYYKSPEALSTWENEGWTPDYGQDLISVYERTVVMELDEEDSLRQKIEKIMREV